MKFVKDTELNSGGLDCMGSMAQSFGDLRILANCRVWSVWLCFFFLVKLMSLVSTLRDSRDMRWLITGHDMSCGFTLGVTGTHATATKNSKVRNAMAMRFLIK